MWRVEDEPVITAGEYLPDLWEWLGRLLALWCE